MRTIETIGIVGDGQLGRMIVEDGLKFNPNLRFIALGTAGFDSPAAQVGATQLEGGLADAESIARLVEASDVTTWEIEHINAGILHELTRAGHDIQPLPSSLMIIQDKLIQKRYLSKKGIDVAPFTSLETAEAFDTTRTKLGDAIIVKSRRGGYDGRSNLVVQPGTTWAGIEDFFPKSTTEDLYAEKMIDFKRELALIGVRDRLGRIVTYPVVETIHAHNICHTVIYDPDAHIPRAAEELGRATIEAFSGAGVFAVEMFEDYNGDVLVNEVAPRVHNSGHWTDLGAATSQFEQHVRAIVGAPLGSTAPVGPTVMVNILGTKARVFEERMRGTEILDQNAHLRWYGKSPRADGTERKIGHITVTAQSTQHALERAKLLQRSYVG